VTEHTKLQKTKSENRGPPSVLGFWTSDLRLLQRVQLILSSVQLTLLECVTFYCVYFSKYNRMIDDEQIKNIGIK